MKKEKIKGVRVYIAPSLYNEIILSQKKLNEAEQKKPQGSKKHKWTVLKTTHKMGIYLNSLRRE